MMDAIDELVARSKDDRELRAFHALHRQYPEVLDFLYLEIRARIDHGFPSFSYRCLFEYSRWKLALDNGPDSLVRLNDHAVPFYARALTIIWPELNGRAELRKSKADEIFGLAFEPEDSDESGRYARRLMWADGTPLERGWRPTAPHVPTLPPNRKPDIHARPQTEE